jgi:hypothetical protein
MRVTVLIWYPCADAMTDCLGVAPFRVVPDG